MRKITFIILNMNTSSWLVVFRCRNITIWITSHSETNLPNTLSINSYISNLAWQPPYWADFQADNKQHNIKLYSENTNIYCPDVCRFMHSCANHQRFTETGQLKKGKRPGDFCSSPLFNFLVWVSLCPWWPQIPVIGWQGKNPIWQSAIVDYPLQSRRFGA